MTRLLKIKRISKKTKSRKNNRSVSTSPRAGKLLRNCKPRRKSRNDKVKYATTNNPIEEASRLEVARTVLSLRQACSALTRTSMIKSAVLLSGMAPSLWQSSAGRQLADGLDQDEINSAVHIPILIVVRRWAV